MIAWLQPAALWGLGLLVVPLLIHLLRARHAPRVPFPSIHFVRASPVASARIGSPSDLLLLVLRTAIVAAVVLAMSQPLLVTGSRIARWNGLLSRAVVIDTSESMRQLPAADEARRRADHELTAATASFRIESADLREGLRRATAWVRTAPPGRREIVVVSDFQHGSLSAGYVASVSPDVGLRFVPIGTSMDSRSDELQPLFAPGVDSMSQQVQILRDGTRVTLLDARPSDQKGLRLLTEVQAEAGSLLRTVARAGAPAPSAEQPIVMTFAETAAPGPLSPLLEDWMVRTALEIEQDPELGRLAREGDALSLAPSENWLVLLQDRRGRPLVRTGASGKELLVDVAAPASSYLAAAVLRRTLIGRSRNTDRSELEVLTVPPAILADWARQPGPMTTDVWQYAESSDAPWSWAAVIVLLGAEQWLRQKRPRQSEARRAAA
jgi:hypothetical protein